MQIEIAKKVFSPPPDEVKFAKKVLEAIPDGRGVHMIDGKMQDDATWKQCKVMVVAGRDACQEGPRAGRRIRALRVALLRPSAVLEPAMTTISHAIALVARRC